MPILSLAKHSGVWMVALSLLGGGCSSDDGSTNQSDGGGAGPDVSDSGAGATAGAGGTTGRGGAAGLSDASDAADGSAGNGGAGGGNGGNAGTGNRPDAARDGGAGASSSDASRGDADGSGSAGRGGADAGDRDADAGGTGEGRDIVDAIDQGEGAADTDSSSDAVTMADSSMDNDANEEDGGPIVAAGVRWVGRVDLSDAAGPRFAWSGTGFVAQFSGTSVGVNLNNDNVYFFQAVIDGVKSARFQVAKGQAVQTIAAGLAAGVHTLEVYRETEASYGNSQLLGITEGTLLAPPSATGRLVEVVGDSMSAGYGNLGSEPHPNYGDPNPCTFSFDTESAYASYGAVAARALGADASLIAMSGWGVFRSRTSDTTEVLPVVYSNTLGVATSPVWDFHLQPQAVVINLGTNDFAPGDPGSAYTTALGAFIDTVRAKYPAAWIFCAVGTMYDNTQEAQAQTYVQAAVSSRGGDAGKVVYVDLGSQDALQGTGCDWHPNVTEDQRMADVLVPVIKQKLGW